MSQTFEFKSFRIVIGFGFRISDLEFCYSNGLIIK